MNPAGWMIGVVGVVIALWVGGRWRHNTRTGTDIKAQNNTLAVLQARRKKSIVAVIVGVLVLGVYAVVTGGLALGVGRSDDSSGGGSSGKPTPRPTATCRPWDHRGAPDVPPCSRPKHVDPR